MRTIGTKDVLLFECINPYKNKWRVRWDIQEHKETGNNGFPPYSYIDFEEVEFLHKPSRNEIKDIIISWFNSKIEKTIMTGFVWNGIPVWLSVENQFNYKAAYDLAVQTESQSLPVTFKLGTDVEPVYFEFKTLIDIQDFYMKAMAFKDKVLSEGWKAKDAFDFAAYDI